MILKWNISSDKPEEFKKSVLLHVGMSCSPPEVCSDSPNPGGGAVGPSSPASLWVSAPAPKQKYSGCGRAENEEEEEDKSVSHTSPVALLCFQRQRWQLYHSCTAPDWCSKTTAATHRSSRVTCRVSFLDGIRKEEIVSPHIHGTISQSRALESQTHRPQSQSGCRLLKESHGNSVSTTQLTDLSADQFVHFFFIFQHFCNTFTTQHVRAIMCTLLCNTHLFYLTRWRSHICTIFLHWRWRHNPVPKKKIQKENKRPQQQIPTALQKRNRAGDTLGPEEGARGQVNFLVLLKQLGNNNSCRWFAGSVS